MRILTQTEVREALPWQPLIEAIKRVFSEGCELPLRTAHTVKIPNDPDATLLLMPAWQGGRFIVVKIANIVPGNGARGTPAVTASVLVFDGRTGEALAILEGGELTARRTAAASALAASFLARADARHLLVVGTGRIASKLISAHCAVRSYDKISVWGRNPESAVALAKSSRQLAREVDAVADLASAARSADVISCATLSREPLVLGAWLKPGTHLDLVGAYTPDMRESDDEAVRRVSGIFVDTFEGAMAEAGDLLQPMAAGWLSQKDIASDLAGLCKGLHPGRRENGEITLFKSVGTALEDYAAAALALEPGPS
jgi:alanine dehydrogenase